MHTNDKLGMFGTVRMWNWRNAMLKELQAICIGKSKIEMGIAHKKASHAINYLQPNQRHIPKRESKDIHDMKQTSAYWITFYQRGKGKKSTKFAT